MNHSAHVAYEPGHSNQQSSLLADQPGNKLAVCIQTSQGGNQLAHHIPDLELADRVLWPIHVSE